MIGNFSIICRSTDIPTVDLDGEVAMMNPDKGKYYGFDSIASRVWEIIFKPITYEELINQLIVEYDVSKQTCENDIRSLLEKLLKEGLITTK